MNPMISILIPCFNAERWVAQAIESALAQTCADKEVIVVDDGSTDASLEIIRRFGDRIRYETGPNRGGGAARNRLLQLATGEWLQYLDADDYLLPGKVDAQLGFLRQNPEVDVVFGPVILDFTDDGGSRTELLPIPEPNDPWVLLARWYLPQTGAPLWRKSAIEDVGGWKADQPMCQEHELYLRLLKADKRFTFFLSTGAVYRQWGESTVSRRDQHEVRRRRLDIEQRAEGFLRERGELTPARHWAINQARFEMARMAWQSDREEARAIVRTIRQSKPDFRPAGEAAPRHYQIVYALLGFEPTELLAEWRRRIVGGRPTA